MRFLQITACTRHQHLSSPCGLITHACLASSTSNTPLRFNHTRLPRDSTWTECALRQCLSQLTNQCPSCGPTNIPASLVIFTFGLWWESSLFSVYNFAVWNQQNILVHRWCTLPFDHVCCTSRCFVSVCTVQLFTDVFLLLGNFFSVLPTGMSLCLISVRLLGESNHTASNGSSQLDTLDTLICLLAIKHFWAVYTFYDNTW